MKIQMQIHVEIQMKIEIEIKIQTQIQMKINVQIQGVFLTGTPLKSSKYKKLI